MLSPAPGSLVQCREREWVILPSQGPDLLLLRPLTGSEQAAVDRHENATEEYGVQIESVDVRVKLDLDRLRRRVDSKLALLVGKVPRGLQS